MQVKVDTMITTGGILVAIMGHQITIGNYILINAPGTYTFRGFADDTGKPVGAPGFRLWMIPGTSTVCDVSLWSIKNTDTGEPFGTATAPTVDRSA